MVTQHQSLTTSHPEHQRCSTRAGMLVQSLWHILLNTDLESMLSSFRGLQPPAQSGPLPETGLSALKAEAVGVSTKGERVYVTESEEQQRLRQETQWVRGRTKGVSCINQNELSSHSSGWTLYSNSNRKQQVLAGLWRSQNPVPCWWDYKTVPPL